MNSAAELVAAIKNHFPRAGLNYRPDPLAMEFHGQAQGVTYDDHPAEKEWGWKPQYSLEGRVAGFYEEMKANLEQYRSSRTWRGSLPAGASQEAGGAMGENRPSIF